MSDLEKLTSVFDEIGIDYVVREKQGIEDIYRYLFIGECRNIHNPGMTFENGDLDSLLAISKFFEFENGKLCSYSNS